MGEGRRRRRKRKRGREDERAKGEREEEEEEDEERENKFRSSSSPFSSPPSLEALISSQNTPLLAPQDNICSLCFTGEKFLVQPWYWCHTCGMTGSDGVCG